jgi:peptide/nickel transport system substrate-binding protein
VRYQTSSFWRLMMGGMAAATLAGLSLAGCGSAGTAQSSGEALRVAVSTTVTTLSPQPYGPADYYFERAVYDPLVDLENGKPVPMLAASWTESSDDRSLTLMLRKGVTFSDGTPFDAVAAAWNVNWIKQPSTGAQAVAEWKQVTPVVINAHELRLDFSQPMPEIFGMLSAAPIVKPNGQSRGIGTGPFTVSAFKPGVSLTLTRNSRYWAAGTPRLASIVFTNYPDPAAAALAVQSGSSDVLLGAPYTQINTLKSAGLRYLAVAGGGADDILVNAKAGPLSNPKVREALSLAFDRQSFVRIATSGYAQPMYSIFPATSPAYSPATNTGSFDLSQAKSLLRQAGYTSLSLTVEAAPALPQATFLPVYQQDLAKIGVKLTISQVDLATYVKAAAMGNFPQLLVHQYSFGTSDPGLLFTAYPFQPASNAEHYVSAAYQQMVGRAGVEPSGPARTAAYRDIDRYVQTQAFVIPLASDPIAVMHSSRVGGLSLGADGTVIDYSHADLDG